MGAKGDPERTGEMPGRSSDFLPALAKHPRYRVLKLLGEGGMGTVYLAEHRKMARLVALKVINGDLLGNDQVVRRFYKEVRAVALLAHPNIVAAYDADEADAGSGKNVHFLVMEYVPGQTLHAYLKARGPLPPAEACHFARQVALGLQHAHEKRMVHRDIKPVNLIRTETGDVKILDFGLARLTLGEDVAQSMALTAPGQMAGTPDYIAPEQVNDAHSVDIRADIYSLGGTLYTLLSGWVPFPGGNAVEKVLRHATVDPRPLSALRDGLPAGLASIVARMMAKDPNQRYQTPAEVAVALSPYTAENLTTVAYPSPGSPTVPELGSTQPEYTPPPPRWKKDKPESPSRSNHRGTVAAVSTLTAVLTVAALVVAWGTGRDKPPLTKVVPVPVVEKPEPAPRPAPPAPAPVAVSIPPLAAPSPVVPKVNHPREIHGADVGSLQSWADSLQADNYMPIFLSVHAGEGKARFNAWAAHQLKPRRFRLRLGVERQATYAFPEEDRESGLHFQNVCPYNEGDHTFLAIVETDGGGHARYFGTLNYMTNLLAERLQNRQSRPYSLCRTPVKNGRTFYCVFSNLEFHPWEAHLGLNGPTLRAWIDGLKERNWRPALLSCYETVDGLRYIAEFVENPQGDRWDFRADLSADAFEEALAANRERGLWPRAVTSHGPSDQPIYTAVWLGPPLARGAPAAAPGTSKGEPSR